MIRIHIQIGQKETGIIMTQKRNAADRRNVPNLTEEQERKVRETAEEVLNRYRLLPGFDLARFLTRQEGFVLALKEMDAHTTGVLMIDPNQTILQAGSDKMIIINQKLQEKPDFQQRSRFIAAHEYGHSKLHASGGRFFHRDTPNVDTPQEREAEYFARCLLMPEQSVRELMRISGMAEGTRDEKTAMISRFFNVTRKKALQRMEDLVLA